MYQKQYEHVFKTQVFPRPINRHRTTTLRILKDNGMNDYLLGITYSGLQGRSMPYQHTSERARRPRLKNCYREREISKPNQSLYELPRASYEGEFACPALADLRVIDPA